MVKAIIAILFIFSADALAIPGYFGDTKVISFNETNFVVEQAGYRLVVDTNKLPEDMVPVWKKNVGKIIESPIPYTAVIKETKIANFVAPKETNR
jgi:hypothetical protein